MMKNVSGCVLTVESICSQKEGSGLIQDKVNGVRLQMRVYYIEYASTLFIQRGNVSRPKWSDSG